MTTTFPSSAAEHTVVLLDLETWALPNAAALIEKRGVKVPGNYTNPDAIAKYIAETKAKMLAKAALDFDLARIAIAGIQVIVPMTEAPVIGRATNPNEEYELVRQLMPLINNPFVTLYGHNLLGYDLPLLDRRAFDFGIPLMTRRRKPHYRGIDYGIDDLMERMAEDRDGWRSLEYYCDRYREGLNEELADPLVNGGADVEAALQAGRWDDVEAHLRADLRRLEAMYWRARGVHVQPLTEIA